VCLRQKNEFNRERTPTFCPADLAGQKHFIAKREHLLAPEVPELIINVCAGLREFAVNKFSSAFSFLTGSSRTSGNMRGFI
jgi:hypothetical protein